MKKYKPRDKSRLNKEQAQKYGNRIEVLMKGQRGRVTPVEVLTDASKKSSPLHDFFTWNDSRAAVAYRIEQARYLLNNIVEVVVMEGVKTEQKSFFNVQSTRSTPGVYVTFRQATTKVSYRRELLARIINHLENTTQLMKVFQSFEK